MTSLINNVFVLLLIFTTVCHNITSVDARPLNDIISIGAIKASGGPSSGGEGHSSPNVKEISNSGPASGGEGHSNAAKKVEKINNSGPSAGGEGHEFLDAETLGGKLSSGPAAGGEGHKLKDSQFLGENKNSGPSRGGEGH